VLKYDHHCPCEYRGVGFHRVVHLFVRDRGMRRCLQSESKRRTIYHDMPPTHVVVFRQLPPLGVGVLLVDLWEPPRPLREPPIDGVHKFRSPSACRDRTVRAPPCWSTDRQLTKYHQIGLIWGIRYSDARHTDTLDPAESHDRRVDGCEVGQGP